MRALIQRSTGAKVSVDSQVVGQVSGPSLCILVGVTTSDTAAQAEKLADKTINLRCFQDDHGVANLSVAEISAPVLVISQFTLYADTGKGRRPSYLEAARPEHAEPLVEAYILALRSRGARVETGRFRTEMKLELTNDGPFTLLLEV